MKNLDKITEEIVDTSDRFDFVIKFYPDIDKDRFYKDKLYRSHFQYAHFVYIQNDQKYIPIIIAFHALTLSTPTRTRSLGIKSDFTDALMKYKPETFQDCLIFIRLYMNELKYCDYNPGGYIKSLKQFYPISQKIRKCGIVDEILRETHGIIAWRYQLENILWLLPNMAENINIIKTFADELINSTGYEELVLTRSDMPPSKEWEETKKFVIDDSLTLFDILHERILLYGLGRIETPTIQYSYNLYKALKKELTP